MLRIRKNKKIDEIEELKRELYELREKNKELEEEVRKLREMLEKYEEKSLEELIEEKIEKTLVETHTNTYVLKKLREIIEILHKLNEKYFGRYKKLLMELEKRGYNFTLDDKMLCSGKIPNSSFELKVYFVDGENDISPNSYTIKNFIQKKYLEEKTISVVCFISPQATYAYIYFPVVFQDSIIKFLRTLENKTFFKYFRYEKLESVKKLSPYITITSKIALNNLPKEIFQESLKDLCRKTFFY
ncbi:MAG: hypothetical protein QXL82_01870 [Candidatus Aenigmatarchaeota archaeon]